MKKIIMVLGKSGSGKDYLVERVLIHDRLSGEWVGLKKYSTRPPRKEETKNFNMFMEFISDKEYNELLNQGKFLVTSSFETEQGIWRYALEFPESDYSICIGDLEMYDKLAGLLCEDDSNEISLIPIYIDTKDKERLLKSISRTPYDLERVCARFIKDQHDFSKENEVFRKLLLNNALYIKNDYDFKSVYRLIDICQEIYDSKSQL